MKTNTIEAKTLKVLMTNDGNSIYSENSGGSVLSTFNNAVRGTLFDIDNSYELKPKIIKTWNWDFKNNAYILKIDPNYTFHDGTKPNSKDLEFTLLRGFFSEKRTFYEIYLSSIEGIDKIKPSTKFKSGVVEGIKIIDNLTISVKIKNPNPSFLFSLTRPYFSLTSERFYNDDHVTWKDLPIGVGKYKVISDKNNVLTLENTVKGEKISTIEMHNKKDDLVNYDISYFDNILKKSKKYITENSVSIRTIFFNKENILSKNLNFRKSIFYIINRLDLIGQSDESKPSYSFLTTSHWINKNQKDNYDFKKSLEYAEKIPLELKNKKWKVPVYSASDTISPITKKITDKLEIELKKIGLNIEFYANTNKFLSKEISEQSPFSISGRICDNLDPLLMFGSFRSESANKHDNAQNDKVFDTLYEYAAKAEGNENRVQTVQSLSEYTLSHVFIIPISEEKNSYYYNPNLIKSIGTQFQPITLDFDQIEFNE